jgi:hypothetical protein
MLKTAKPKLCLTTAPRAERHIIKESLAQTLDRAAVAAFNPAEADTDTRTRPLNPISPSPRPITLNSMLPLDAALVGFAELTTGTS